MNGNEKWAFIQLNKWAAFVQLKIILMNYLTLGPRYDRFKLRPAISSAYNLTRRYKTHRDARLVSYYVTVQLILTNTVYYLLLKNNIHNISLTSFFKFNSLKLIY